MKVPRLLGSRRINGPGPRLEVKDMELKVWSPLLDLDRSGASTCRVSH